MQIYKIIHIANVLTLKFVLTFVKNLSSFLGEKRRFQYGQDILIFSIYLCIR